MQLQRIQTALLPVVMGALISCHVSNQNVAESQNSFAANGMDRTIPAKTLPQGYESYNDPQSTGRLIYFKSASGATSATAAMRQFLGSLKGVFDAPLRITAATGDPQDTVVQAMLNTEIGGQPVEAVAAVATAKESSTAGLMYDRTGLLRASYPRLSSYFSKQIGKPAETRAESATPDISTWTRQTGGDQSTSVLLPPDWRLTTVASGSAGMDGPNKEQVVLGFQTFVAPGSRTYAPYMNPEKALRWFVQSQGVQLVSVIDHAPAAQMNPGGEAEFITAEVEQADGSRYKALSLVMTNPMQMNIWKFYISYIAAPEDRFEAARPTMIGIWNNWKLDSGYVQRSLAQAAETQAQTRAMMMEGAQRSMHAFDNVNEAIDEAIRGVSTMENTGTGKRAETPIGTEQQVLNACVRRGISCRVVPTNELVPPQ